MVDARGMVRHADGHFEEILRREWPSWHGSHVPRTLLEFLMGSAMPFRGQAIQVACHRLGDVFLLKARPLGAVDALTRRERQIAERVAHGASHKDVASELGLAPATVRNYIQAIYGKLGVHGKAELASVLARSG